MAGSYENGNVVKVFYIEFGGSTLFYPEWNENSNFGE
jgi:hypothetical protein